MGKFRMSDIAYINASFLVEPKIFRFFIVAMALDELNHIWYCHWMNLDQHDPVTYQFSTLHIKLIGEPTGQINKLSRSTAVIVHILNSFTIYSQYLISLMLAHGHHVVIMDHVVEFRLLRVTTCIPWNIQVQCWGLG